MRWRDLPSAKQNQVAYYWAKKISDEPQLIDADFRSVSVGYRLRKGRLNRIVCLRFRVANKRRRLPPGVRAIPDEIPVTIRLGKACHTVGIPTDVESLSDGAPQLSIKVVDPPRARFESKGVATALVKDTANGSYLLSCHHVLAASQVTTTLAGVRFANVLGNTFGLPGVIARLSTKAQFPHTSQKWAIDSALARIDASSTAAIRQIFVNRKNTENIRTARLSRRTFAKDTPVRILTARARIRGVIIDHMRWGGVFEYNAMGVTKEVKIKEVYTVKTHAGKTIKGDSGSPVVIDDVLVGMHFWGNPASKLSYFIPSYVAMSSETFGFRLAFVG